MELAWRTESRFCECLSDDKPSLTNTWNGTTGLLIILRRTSNHECRLAAPGFCGFNERFPWIDFGLRACEREESGSQNTDGREAMSVL
jgi:hypothetical protein